MKEEGVSACKNSALYSTHSTTVSSANAIPHPPVFDLEPPTRKCCLCDILENPKATAVYAYTWICPECVEKLKRVIRFG